MYSKTTFNKQLSELKDLFMWGLQNISKIVLENIINLINSLILRLRKCIRKFTNKVRLHQLMQPKFYLFDEF